MPLPKSKQTKRLFFDPEQPGEELAGARLLPLALVDANPTQSRQVFNEMALQELAQSIQEHGVLEPILVRPTGDGRYQIVAGERRTRAATLAGLGEIPALIRDLTDEEAAYATAIENLQREDLDLEDEARWLAYLQELTRLSERQLADRLGKGRMWVNRRLRMLRERPDLFAQIRDGALTQEAAMTVLAHGDTPPESVSQAVTITTDDSDEEDVSQPVTRAERAAPTAFRWRPWQQLATVVARTRPEDVPAEERATFEAQLAQLEEQIQALRRGLRGE